MKTKTLLLLLLLTLTGCRDDSSDIKKKAEESNIDFFECKTVAVNIIGKKLYRCEGEKFVCFYNGIYKGSSFHSCQEKPIQTLTTPIYDQTN